MSSYQHITWRDGVHLRYLNLLVLHPLVSIQTHTYSTATNGTDVSHVLLSKKLHDVSCVCVILYLCLCVCIYVWLHLCNICVLVFMFVRTSRPFLSQILGLFYIECVCFEHANLMCVFVFSISTPSGNICMSVRGCKVADRTALIHQLKHTHTCCLPLQFTLTYTRRFSDTLRNYFHTISLIYILFASFIPLSLSLS